ncbi:hypothetical protein ACFO25_15930 [Paenactinomyces guangxiensis]|uniref:Uncharacterized protein n=1 Tax=Paenactinomyces guangxiensis TaxID=1490290 RepID=A0A7W2A983_9BACL|nr:hypothetical protein [Paenactinomyces guangxiensis]MBA4496351.1 hypothetical protein [Paenactinomyces guangxiensis]MBH8593615.1 hypothetical protein [Paenactinomyces guangxiensis]
MDSRDRDDYFSWTKPGEIEFLEIQCETCKHNKLANPTVCTKYPDGKPVGVLRAEEKCPGFKEKKEGKWKDRFSGVFRAFKK